MLALAAYTGTWPSLDFELADLHLVHFVEAHFIMPVGATGDIHRPSSESERSKVTGIEHEL